MGLLVPHQRNIVLLSSSEDTVNTINEGIFIFERNSSLSYILVGCQPPYSICPLRCAEAYNLGLEQVRDSRLMSYQPKRYGSASVQPHICAKTLLKQMIWNQFTHCHRHYRTTFRAQYSRIEIYIKAPMVIQFNTNLPDFNAPKQQFLTTHAVFYHKQYRKISFQFPQCQHML